MHLLAAKPGGFVDDEGIIDLAQTPADIVVLAAADSLLHALAQGVEALHQHIQHDTLPSIRLANWLQLQKPAAYDLYEDKVLQHAQVIVVSFLGGQHYWQYGYERLQAWAKAGANRQLILVPGDDTPDPDLANASTVDQITHTTIWRYLRQSGAENIHSFFHSLLANVMSLDESLLREWQLDKDKLKPAKILPHCLLYQSGGVISFSEWKAQQDKQAVTQPICLVLFYRSHLQSGNTQVFDQLAVILREQGLSPLLVAVTSLKETDSLALLNELIAQTNAKLILNTTGFSSNRMGSPDVANLPTDFQSSFAHPIPVLQLILSSSTEEDWQQQKQGLRSRDMAMQVVLPEMDGRIISRAISFKSANYYDPHCQIDLVRYAIHQERATFVAKLAKAFVQLAEKANAQKRVALILANYPTKDGRIGNGVGLDTPASTVTILNALAQAGYPVSDIPPDGNALIQQLLGSITNNPNTLHYLGCWQSLSVSEYKHYFVQLPVSVQQAVLDRWGEPEEDHKCRFPSRDPNINKQGEKGMSEPRIMLAGIRLGETFVGIQPARGFNLDLTANYHDPDLVPPHSYLAYYFWLRHVYQVDAIIHVGKHGNLEWLPGKGSALSNECWPDVILGPMPHFYPFIVNDPGEGSQAKRRTQAVIVDHLMPPMTRAETYGELAELENLVDEYYQAMGMDERRENWLKQQILQQVKDSHLLEELLSATGANTSQNNASDEQLLEELDAYLCDIKEAQIRHGLHRLGELPNTDKLADTIVALLRLPRGTTATEQGIIHALAQDFGFLPASEQTTEKASASATDSAPFDPLANSTQTWKLPQPAALQVLSDKAWRTHADTKERLEIYAQQLIRQYVLEEATFEPELMNLPATCGVLNYAKQTLFAALQQSAIGEIAALTTGLAGKFVPPGPSGAPTRGRLDVLPTGRNFFSVDNRAIPSQAAWALGQKSAQKLIERHLQEQGDYPQSLGLSVWGTATMRTGGDDIAQAFALMGVRPIWAAGSNRVQDIEVIPCMLLGRPRVDVTLRVSGFFRDAFPNVMRLYQAAVMALADYDEAGTGNTIRANIDVQTTALQAQGMSADEAKQQASYRVFGSKPGAYGAGLQGLIDERCWDTGADLAEAYVNWGGYAYGALNEQGNYEGVEAKSAFVARLSTLQAVVQNQDNREHDLLDSDDYYQFQGGMSNAVQQFSGAMPAVYHNDHSNPSAPKVRTLKEELNRVIRSRVLNPKWINAMQEHGYKGAFEMAATVDYLFAYDATTDFIADYQYKKVCDELVFADENRRFLKENNPQALEEMAERLLEACQRGMWQDHQGYAERLQDLLLEIDQQQEQAN